MNDGDWYRTKEEFENSLTKFKDAVNEDGRDLEEELNESLKAVIDDRDIDVSVY